jgi:hypothetical protein
LRRRATHQEWQRRAIAIAYAAVFAGFSRMAEPIYIRWGLDPMWITRIIAIGILVLSIRLADLIPDENWPSLRLQVTTGLFVYLMLVAIWLTLWFAITGGPAH